jgi:CRP/FNR family transcriptional regulator, cyclic AMP receptor protein
MQESRYLKANAENIQKLMEIPVLQDFETSDLGDLLKWSKIRKFKAGEEIIREGDSRDTRIYFLFSGQVRIAKGNKKLAVLKRSGDIFGEMSILGHTDRSASVYADNDVTCLTTDAVQIEKLSGNDRVAFSYILYRIFAEILSQRLRSTTEELVKAHEEIERLSRRPEPECVNYVEELTILEVDAGPSA